MKIKLSEIPLGGCFTRKKGAVEKKDYQGRVCKKGRDNKVRCRAPKGDPVVEQQNCPLWTIGVGMRKHPDEVVEIGDGRPRVRGVRSLRDR